MKKGLVATGIISGIGYAIKKAVESISMDTAENREIFHGVPLSELTALAKELHSDQYCLINDNGYLDFYHRSNRGHTPLCSHDLYVIDGKLHYDGDDSLGTWGSGKTSSFIAHANERFHFN